MSGTGWPRGTQPLPLGANSTVNSFTKNPSLTLSRYAFIAKLYSILLAKFKMAR